MLSGLTKPASFCTRSYTHGVRVLIMGLVLLAYLRHVPVFMYLVFMAFFLCLYVCIPSLSLVLKPMFVTCVG